MLEKMEGVQFNGGVGGGIASYSNYSHHKENMSNIGRTFPAKNVQNQQFDSVYSASLEDTHGMRASTKVLNPPGGRSTGFCYLINAKKYPQEKRSEEKGRIAVGADADLVLWKLSMKHQTSTLSQHSSLFKVSTPHMKPVMTICGGRIAYSNGK
ncbi:hypothetical protein X798_07636, partial [Onchocerca flexuosa]